MPVFSQTHPTTHPSVPYHVSTASSRSFFTPLVFIYRVAVRGVSLLLLTNLLNSRVVSYKEGGEWIRTMVILQP